MGLRGQLWGRQGLAIVVWRRELQGRLVVRKRHARWEVHLYTVMDVFLFDQPPGAAAGGRRENHYTVILVWDRELIPN